MENADSLDLSTPDAWAAASRQLREQNTATQIGNNVYNAATVNPDTFAHQRRLGQAMGVPVQSVAAYPDDITRQAKVQALNPDGLVQTHPKLAQFLTVQDNANLMHDDVQNAAAIEHTVAQSATEWKPSLGQRVRQWLDDTFGLNDREKARAWVQFAAKRSGVTPEGARGAVGGMSETPEQFTNKLVNTGSFGLLPDLAGNANTPMGEVAGAGGALTGFVLGGPIKAVDYAAEKVGLNILEHTAGESFAKALARDVLGQGGRLGAAGALSEVGSNLDSADIPTFLKKEVASFASNAEMGAVFGAAGRVLPDTTLAQTMLRIAGVNTAMDVLNGTSPLDSRSTEKKVFDYGLNTLFSLHGAGRVEGGWLHDAATDAAKADIAAKDYQTLNNISQLAAASKLRERDPDLFKEYVQNVTEDGHLENVYVDGAVFAQELRKAGITPDELRAKMPEVAQQMNEAMQTEGMVRIPTADYATHIAGGDMDATLLQHLKTDPEGKTYAEAQEFYQQQVGQMKDLAAKVSEQKAQNDAWKQSQQAVHDDVLGQIGATGRFTPDVAKAYAAMHRDFYTALADRLGLTPEEAYKQYGAKVVAEGAGGLEQPPTGPFGPVLTGFKGDAKGAIAKLKEMRDGEAVGALHHPEIGDIDLPWGDAGTGASDGYGLAKLVKYHPEVVDDLQGAISAMQVVSRSKNRVNLESADHRAGVRLTWDSQTKHWLVTAFKKREGGGDATRTDTGTLSGKDDTASLADASDAIVDQKLEQFYAGGQAPRGYFDPTGRAIGLLQNADLSTFVHESGHFFLDTYAKIASLPDTPAAIRGDMDKVLKWFGVDSLEKWNAMSLDEQRPHHEQLARGFEAYLMEGKAPTLELQPIFSRVRTWLVNLYRSLRSLNVQLTPEVRGVFDRMLASEDAIKEAENARSFTSLFTTKPEGMTPEEWADYQMMSIEATQEAVDQLQAKSLKDMKWLSGAKSRAMSEAQKQADIQRQAIRAEVEKEVDQMPVYRAEKFLREGAKEVKLNSEQLRDRYAGTDLGAFGGEQARWEALGKGKNGMLAKGGMDLDLAAEMHGFKSGDELVRSLLDAEPRSSVVSGLTDRYMLERHGELATPDAVARAAEAAIHNDVRARFIATGLKVLTKPPIPARQLVKGAREAADAAIAAKRVRDVNPRQYEAAEAKANKEALKLVAKDPTNAIQAQRASLLNNQLVKAAQQAILDVEQLRKMQAKYDKDSIRKKMDPDILDQIDALRDRFDFRRIPTPDKKIAQLQQWVDAQKALGYAPVEIPDMVDPAVRMHYEDMTVEQMRGLRDTLASMEHLARERKTITVDGQRHDLQAVVNDMVDKMAERGAKFTDAELAERLRPGVDPVWRVAMDRTASWLRGAGADMVAQHFKANRYDNHEILGPFHRMLFEPVFAANYKFLDLRREVSNHFREAAKTLGGDWQKSLNEVVGGHTLMDNALDTPTQRRLTRGDLIGIALHVGNESNFDKLTRGMGWTPEGVWKTLDDNMRREDWEAARILGEAAGAHWEDMAAMNRRLGNTMPERIQPRPFSTKYGEMPGWYAPLRYDPIRSKLAVKKEQARAVNPEEGLFGRNYYRGDTTTNGSLNARQSGYYDFVDLDWHATEQAIHDSLRDLAYREALVNAHKIIANKDFRRQFMRTYGPEAYKSLDDWLGRVVNSDVGDERTNRFVALMRATRRAVVANGVAFRISTMLKHGGSAGIKSLGYFAGGGEKYFLARAKAIGLDHSNQVVEALAKFPEIRARAEQQDRDFSQTIASLMEPESIHGKAERFGHAGVAYLDFMTAVPTAHAAYDWAVTEGIPKRLGGTGQPMSEADAIKFASGVVREAHGTNIETGRSNLINSRSEIIKMFTVLHGFMNNAFGQHMDAYDKMRMKEFGRPELLARYLAVMIAPAIAVGLVVDGTPDKDEPWWKWAAGAIGGEYSAMVPLVREVYSEVFKGFHSAGLPPWFKAAGDLAKPVQDAGKAAQGKEVPHPIKDVGNAAGLFLPGLGQAGATSQFLYDVATGEQHPQTVEEWLRGTMTGDMQKH